MQHWRHSAARHGKIMYECYPARTWTLHVVYLGKDHVFLAWDEASTQTATKKHHAFTCCSFFWMSLLLKVASHLWEASSLLLAILLLHPLDWAYVCTSSTKDCLRILCEVCCLQLISSLRSKINNEIEVLALPFNYWSMLYNGYGAFSVNQCWHRNWVLVFK